MIVSVSLVLLLGLLIVFLIRYTKLRAWQAILCILFGFYIASTPLGALHQRRGHRGDPPNLRDPTLNATRPDAASNDPAIRVINRLCRELAAARLQYANLLAAARVTVASARDGDPYALEFLEDELVVRHGQADLEDPPFERARSADAAAQCWTVRR